MILGFGKKRPCVALAACLSACGGAVDEAGANRLWEKIQMEDYRSWEVAPGYETPQPTIRAHGDTARVFLNPSMAEALSGPAIAVWPDGSLIVKESFDGDDLSLIAAMEKQSGSWFYAEWEGGGDVKFGGEPEVCVNCHSAGEDFILAVALPKG